MVSPSIQSVNIRPEVSILSILKSVNYKAWYAIAEFVDNAIQSAIANYDSLVRLEGDGYHLRVSVEIDTTSGQEKITIHDNANGINLTEFPRAFRPASLPVDRSGLSEFGMGMKSAACWFADHWTVRTSAIDEPVERTVTFDVQRIVDQQIEDIPIRERPAPRNAHFTEITLTRLNVLPQTKTVTKIKSHLSSMYRVFLREGFLELTYNGQPVIFQEPAILVAPYCKAADTLSIHWKKEIDCEIVPGMRITGFAALLEKGSTTNAGFALLRRNRVILGSDDEGYRPQEIFGHPNSFIYQRLFGELHLEGFEVSHTKDGIQWNHHEEAVLQKLKTVLNEQPIPLLEQARDYRARPKSDTSNVQATKTKSPPPSPSTSMSPTPSITLSPSTKYSQSTSQIPSSPPVAETPYPKSNLTPPASSTSEFKTHKSRVLKIALNGEVWKIRVDLSNEEGIGDWWSIQGRSDDDFEVDIRLSLAHPFMTEFCHADICLEALIRVAASMAVAEIGAQNVGIQKSGTFRRFVNQVLRDGFLED